MNRRTEKEHLLDDVLCEAAPADFRAATLDETLRLVGRRRRWRNTKRVAGVLAALVVIAMFILRKSPQPGAFVAEADAPSYTLIRTKPLPSVSMIATQPLAKERVIVSVSTMDAVPRIVSRGTVRFINDDELLALVSPRPAVLVRLGPDFEQLVFANAADEKGFPVN